MIRAGGKIRRITAHMLKNRHPEIQRQHVAHVLENWVIRGTRADPAGRESRVYFAFVPELNKGVRVAVSMDDKSVVAAFIDRAATRNWQDANRGYFSLTYSDVEKRNGG